MDDSQHVQQTRCNDAQIDTLRDEIDGRYRELMTFHNLSPDDALLGIARLSAWAAATRSQVTRMPSMFATIFLKHELVPFQDQLELQARLFGRMTVMKRPASRP